MGSKNKLKRFKENEGFNNVFQPSREDLLNDKFNLKGNWNRLAFKNSNPIVVELGCGKGEYTVGLARMFPEKNFIGIDIKGARFWKGAKTSLSEKINNVLFVRAQIELIENIFLMDEINEIWITFPDPQIKYKRTKHRLVNIDFLNRYKNILIKGGIINLKTDNEFLHGYLIGLIQGMGDEIIYSNHDIYNCSGAPIEATAIQTYYESLYLTEGKPITYLKFRYND
ncbi:MAG: tRNA (guanosine(46)-N7)-methyltransferase TrmB [Flavobacteriaceae bacterium]|nr:tRNA (guanosine(46)-N7)-methyltransferase TrmB [Flavobacteriaceae bacterium]